MAIGSTFVLSFDGKAVQRGLASMKASFKSISSGLASIATKGSLIGGALLAGAGAAAAIGLKINDMGEQALLADRRLESITKQMGLFGNESDTVTERLLKFADAQERATGVDTIVQTQAKLMTFKELAKSANQMGGAFDRATMAAVDMASAGFGSAEQNAVQLGKALNDPVKGINSLTRSGITFTAQEKKMIAEMVRLNQTGKAQDMVLKAIETQVGGTAAATATASGKIKQSANQIMEAFAIPFSQGFSQLPQNLESVFEELSEKSRKWGESIGTAIAEAIAGDTTKLAAVGDLIGSTIGAGAMAALTKIVSDAELGVKNIFTQRKNWFTGEVNPEDVKKQESRRLSFQELLDSNMINYGVREKADAILGTSPKPYQPSPYSPQGINESNEVFSRSVDRIISEMKQMQKAGSKL